MSTKEVVGIETNFLTSVVGIINLSDLEIKNSNRKTRCTKPFKCTGFIDLSLVNF